MSARIGVFDIKCIDLELCLQVAFSNQWSADKDGIYRVNAYKKKNGRLILGDVREPRPDKDGDDWVLMLAPVSAREAVPMVKQWLREQEYPREPDIDGHCTKSWRVYNGPWGYADDWQGLCFVEPYWAEYHK